MTSAAQRGAGGKLPILEQMAALADGLRGRMLLLLERQELTVSELCAVLQLPQSTVSRHLKVLSENAWVTSRPEGTKRLYQMGPDGSGPRELWQLTREALESTVAAERDAERLGVVLGRRRARSEAFFASEAERWDGLRDEMFGADFYLRALPGLLDPASVAGDLGCGSGAVAEALAPFVERVVAVDGSARMLRAARERLERFENVRVRRGELESLPLEDECLDVATLILVLHHLPDPGRAVAEVARVLRPGGRVLIVDMLPHERHEYQQKMGHVWMGFSEKQALHYLEQAELQSARVCRLPPDPGARGPALFAASAIRPSRPKSSRRATKLHSV